MLLQPDRSCPATTRQATRERHWGAQLDAEPSAADSAITTRLAEALALVEVRLIDHFVVGDGEVVA